MIEFVERTEIFDIPVLITGYQNNINQSVLKKIVAKAKQGPTSILRAVLNRAISQVELKNAKKRFPKYRANYQIKKFSDSKLSALKGHGRSLKCSLR